MLDFLAPYWNFLLVHPLISLLVGAYDLVRDFGLAIVLVTVAIRLALYPLFRIQIQNQRAMQELAPAMNDLKAKYGNDKARLSSEQMKLYQERGYNPAMGCLPILLQMPLLLAMYQAKMMQSMQYYFPLLTIFIAWSLPAVLAIYWVTTTLFGIVQQYFVSGWGQLPRFLPFLKNIPSPADRTLAARQQAALEEERRDMANKAAIATNGPGAQNTREARRQRNRNRKK